jgi:sugar/nucleoside kinase (ribokinase family)
MTVVIVGDVGADLLIRLPARSGTALLAAIAPVAFPGGTVGNTAVALARFGLSVAVVSAVGDDVFGRYLRDAFLAHGVQPVIQVIPGRPTMLILAVIDHDGERYLAMYPTEGMASGYHDPEALDIDLVRRASWLHASGSSFREGTTTDTVLRAMRIARDAGVPVSFDMNLRPLDGRIPGDLRSRVLEGVELAQVVLGSAQDEFTLLSPGCDPLAAATRLVGPGRVVVGRLGAEGCMVLEPDRPALTVPAFPVTVVDTIGAGDAFDAGYILAAAEGHDALEAARWGNAAAAASLAGEGAATHLSRPGLAAVLDGAHA